MKESWTDDRLDDLNDRVGELDVRMEARFAQVDARFDALDAKFDAKFDALNARLETKFDALNARFDTKLDAIDARFDAMHRSIIQFGGMMIAAVFGVIATQLALIFTQL